MLAGGFGKATPKGFGAASKPASKAAFSKANGGGTTRSEGGAEAKVTTAKTADTHPALLALIAETPQRRAVREKSLTARAQELKAALETETYTVIDGLLGDSMMAAMRGEAVALLGKMSQTQQIISTDTRAASCIIEPELFMQAPLCTEYVLDCAKTFAPLLSGRFGALSGDASANMVRLQYGTHAHIHTRAHTTRTHSNWCACSIAHVLSFSLSLSHTHTNTQTHTHTHTLTHTCSHTCTYTYIDTYTHTCTHTRTHRSI